MARDSGNGHGNGGDELARRGKDEYDFLKSRAESTPLDHPTVTARYEGLRSRVISGKRFRGRESHEIGTGLNFLYMRHADVVLGMESFDALLVGHGDDLIDELKGCMMIAAYFTVSQAEEYGYWKCLYAYKLMQKLGLETFPPLEKRTFELPDGRSVAFPELTANEVKALAVRKALPPPKETDKVGRLVLKLRTRAADLRKKPEYEPLDVRIFAEDGQPTVTVTSSGRDGAEAARRFLAELWKGL